MSEKTTYRQPRFVRPPGGCEIILVRHGESQPADPDNPFPLVDGHGDPPLHEPDGVEQAEKACRRLIESGEDFAAVYVTTLQRTRQTAKVLLDHLGVEPIVEPDLREVHLGDWEGGEMRKRAAERDPLISEMWKHQTWEVIPNAEKAAVFAARVEGAMERIAEKHADQTVAVFTHGGVIGQVMAMASGSQGFAFTGSDNCGITHIVVTDDRWVVRAFNDTGHLDNRFTNDPAPLI
ncbi:MAG: histidine phosphatase family protein [Acidimicrobiales bacterium]|nr:histidine phosphatase family protein [Acidimicrobiales bacterium]